MWTHSTRKVNFCIREGNILTEKKTKWNLLLEVKYCNDQVCQCVWENVIDAFIQAKTLNLYIVSNLCQSAVKSKCYKFYTYKKHRARWINLESNLYIFNIFLSLPLSLFFTIIQKSPSWVTEKYLSIENLPILRTFWKIC